MKLQRLKNRALRTTGKFPRHTPIHYNHVAFQFAYVYDYITKSLKQQAQVIQNHENASARNVGQGED
jgi:hypothetical protein